MQHGRRKHTFLALGSISGLCFLLLSILPGIAHAEITPNVVWNGDADNCYGKDFNCFLTEMRKGASSAAIRFAERLAAEGDPGWAIEFKELGRIDLLTTMHPERANTNESYTLVNGSPELVNVGFYELTKSDLVRADIKKVLHRSPQPFLIMKIFFVRSETINKATRFVFKDFFAECRACEPLATVEIAYDYNSRGVFQGKKLLRVIPASNP